MTHSVYVRGKQNCGPLFITFYDLHNIASWIDAADMLGVCRVHAAVED